LSRKLDKNVNRALFSLLYRYKEESKTLRRARHRKEADIRAINKKVTILPIKPLCSGINHVTRLIETNKAVLVVIAGDVEPVEIVLWLPCLCQKMKIPYVIVKSKAQLGTVVNRKKTTSLAVQGVNEKDESELAKIIRAIVQHKTQNSKILPEVEQVDDQLCQKSPNRTQNQIPGLI
jgi:large subunit ribosomal protein L7Ae